MQSPKPDWRAVASGAGAGALWGGVFLAPALVPGFSAPQLAAGRFLAYGALSAATLLPRWRTVSRAVGRSERLALLRLSLLGNLLYFVLLSAAIRLAGIPTTSLIAGLLPVTVNWLGRRDSHVPLRRLAAPMLLAVTAAALAALSALASETEARPWTSSLLGVACALAALASWSLFAVANSRWLRRAHHVSPQDWSLLLGVATGIEALALAAPAFLLDARPHDSRAWLEFAAVSAGVAIGASILGNALWNRASRLLPVTLSGQLVVFETLFALLYGFLWAHRGPTGLEVAAMALFLLSIALSARAHSPTPAAPGLPPLADGVEA